MNTLIKIALASAAALSLSACQDDADVASYNLSKAADNFEIVRRVVFYNGISGEYMLEITGRCSIADQKTQLELTCKDGPDAFSKHFLGLSDNVTYFAEQIGAVDVSVFHTRITWKPQSIIPDVDLRTSSEDLFDNASEKNQ